MFGSRSRRACQRIRNSGFSWKVNVRGFSERRKNKNVVRIGCASGFWGDTPTAMPQLLYSEGPTWRTPDYIVLDYLSELTMSLLTAAKQKNPDLGFAPDFVAHAVGPHLAEIKRKGPILVTSCYLCI